MNDPVALAQLNFVANAAAIVLVGWLLYAKRRDRGEVVAYMEREERRQEEANRQASATFDLVKVLCESGHRHYKDAGRVMEKVEQKTEAIAVSPLDVMQAVAAVPEKTAVKVVQKIMESHSGDSGSHPTIRPEEGGS